MQNEFMKAVLERFKDSMNSGASIVGYVYFATRAYKREYVTAYESALRIINNKQKSGGQTNTGDAIQLTIELIESSPKSRKNDKRIVFSYPQQSLLVVA